MQQEEVYSRLADIICEQFHIPALTPKIESQIYRYTHENKLTLAGIAKTIQYCFKYADPPLEANILAGIAFVPYYYQEARRFYEQLARNRAHIPEQAETTPVKVIRIDEDLQRSVRPQKTKLIDITKLGVEDDTT